MEEKLRTMVWNNVDYEPHQDQQKNQDAQQKHIQENNATFQEQQKQLEEKAKL